MDVKATGPAMAGQIVPVSKQDDQQMTTPRVTPIERAADTVSLSPEARAKLEAQAEKNF